ncbi:trans-sialidase, putative, partial [Trypanosoma cruzi marinkellei]
MDEYLGVNATVHNDEAKKKATKTSDGVKFQGAWAEWPVGKQGENQLYHFANHNFTLVATVSIHNVPVGDTPIPLMGAVMNDTDRPVLLGLSYNKERKWQVLCSGKTTEISDNWIPGKTHQLAIVLQTGTKGSVYVDGEHVGNAQCEWENKEDKKISHFYIGGDGDSTGSEKGVSVTVKNVLLYNRPLEDTEIKALNANKVSIPYLEERNTAGVSRSPDGN